MQSTAILLMIITTVSKIIGFAREMVIAYFYGTGTVAQAFSIAFTIPTVLFNFIVSGVMTGFIPMYSRVEKEQGEKEAFNFTANLGNIMMILAGAFFIFGLIFTKPLVRIFALGYTGEQLSLSIYFTRFMMISVFGFALSSVYRGYLNHHHNFIIPAATGFIMNFFTISSVIIAGLTGNLFVLALGTSLAQLLQYILFPKAVKNTGYKHKKIVNFKDSNVRAIIALALPIVIGIAVMDINTIIDRNLASLVMDEGVPVLNYANRLIGFVSGVVIISVTTSVFPRLSRLATDKNMDGMKSTFSQAISILNILVIPAVMGLIIYAKPIVSLLFERGEFSSKDSLLVAGVLAYYAPSLIGIAYRDVLSRMFYSLHDTKTPAINAAIMVILNVIFSVTLAYFMGINGLALGTTIATIAGSLLLFIKLRKEFGSLKLKSMIISSIKILISSGIMGALSYFSYLKLNLILGNILSLFSAIIIAVIIYIIGIFVFKVDEAYEVIDIIKTRFNK